MTSVLYGLPSRLAGAALAFAAATLLLAAFASAAVASKPFVATGSATDVGAEEAKLIGYVAPQALETTYQFEYGTTASYGSSVPVEPDVVGPETQFVEAEELVDGLIPETTYHFRIMATNADGTSYGEDEVFTTGWEPTEAPVLVTENQVDCPAVDATSTSVSGGCLLELSTLWKEQPGDQGIDVNVDYSGSGERYELARNCESWMKVRVDANGHFVMYDHGYTGYWDIYCNSEYMQSYDCWSPETVGYDGQIVWLGGGKFAADVYDYCVNFLAGGGVTDISPIRFELSEVEGQEGRWQLQAQDLLVDEGPDIYITGTWDTVSETDVEMLGL